MPDLSIRTARTTIERGIVDTLTAAYKIRTASIATPATLRAINSVATPHQTLRYVTSLGYVFRFNRFSTSSDDGTTVLKPDDVLSSNPGRWLNTLSTIQAGYAKDVIVYSGESTVEEISERLFAQRPAFLVVWEGADHNVKSTSPGALYKYLCRFNIWAISSNFRAQDQAQEGSDIASEATSSSDPGVIAMIGDAKAALAGSNLGVTGVDYAEITREYRIVSDLSQRIFVDAIGLTVYATLHNPDTGLVTLDDIGTFAVQWQKAAGNGSNGGEDYAKTDFSVATGAGFTQTVSAGSAYVGATLVAVTAQSLSFPASSYTYLDLKSDGTWLQSSVAPGQTEPTKLVGTLRLLIVATDDTGVTGSVMLGNSLVNV